MLRELFKVILKNYSPFTLESISKNCISVSRLFLKLFKITSNTDANVKFFRKYYITAKKRFDFTPHDILINWDLLYVNKITMLVSTFVSHCDFISFYLTVFLKTEMRWLTASAFLIDYDLFIECK